jgi:hypothetical protein
MYRASTTKWRMPSATPSVSNTPRQNTHGLSSACRFELEETGGSVAVGSLLDKEGAAGFMGT